MTVLVFFETLEHFSKLWTTLEKAGIPSITFLKYFFKRCFFMSGRLEMSGNRWSPCAKVPANSSTNVMHFPMIQSFLICRYCQIYQRAWNLSRSSCNLKRIALNQVSWYVFIPKQTGRTWLNHIKSKSVERFSKNWEWWTIMVSSWFLDNFDDLKWIEDPVHQGSSLSSVGYLSGSGWISTLLPSKMEFAKFIMKVTLEKPPEAYEDEADVQQVEFWKRMGFEDIAEVVQLRSGGEPVLGVSCSGLESLCGRRHAELLRQLPLDPKADPCFF